MDGYKLVAIDIESILIAWSLSIVRRITPACFGDLKFLDEMRRCTQAMKWFRGLLGSQ